MSTTTIDRTATVDRRRVAGRLDRLAKYLAAAIRRQGADVEPPKDPELGEVLEVLDRIGVEPGAFFAKVWPPARPAQTLPAGLIQRDLLEIVGELRRLDWRLSKLRDAVDLPPGALEVVDGKFRRETLEVNLYVVSGRVQGSIRDAASYLRKVATWRAEDYPAARSGDKER